MINEMTKSVQIIQIPYDSGYKSLRTGKGPEYLIENGADQILRDLGHDVSVIKLESANSFNTEIGTKFELDRLLAKVVSKAVDDNIFPFILAGNCNSCVGAIAGLDSKKLGVIWLDAHGDFNTPEITLTGFLDGMGLAMITGRCWKTLINHIADFFPVAAKNVVHIGGREFDMAEKAMLDMANIPLIAPDFDDKQQYLIRVRHFLSELRNNIRQVYLHIDLDVLDNTRAKPNYFDLPPGGLPADTVVDIIKTIKDLFQITACNIASFDPSYDKDNIVLNSALKIMREIVQK